VKTTLDFDALNNDNVYVIRAAFDDNLIKTKAEMDELKSSIEKAASKMASSIGLDKKNLKLDWFRCYKPFLSSAKDGENELGPVL
jgi:hypothetical protein